MMDDFEFPKAGAEEQVSSGMLAAIEVYKSCITLYGYCSHHRVDAFPCSL